MGVIKKTTTTADWVPCLDSEQKQFTVHIGSLRVKWEGVLTLKGYCSTQYTTQGRVT